MQGGDRLNIRPYSRIYLQLCELKLRGYFADLNLNLPPLQRDYISSKLIVYKESSGSTFENYLLSIFRSELTTLTNSPQDFFELFKVGLFKTSGYKISDQSPIKNICTKFLLEIEPHIHFYNSMMFDIRLDSDPGYLGRSWRSSEGFTEQGYL